MKLDKNDKEILAIVFGVSFLIFCFIGCIIGTAIHFKHIPPTTSKRNTPKHIITNQLTECIEMEVK